MQNVFGQARLYELDSGSYAEDIPYWRRLVAERRPRSILELGCGSGRLAFPMLAEALKQRADAFLVGIDVSESLLALGQERTAAAAGMTAARLTLKQADMRAFDLGQQFDLIVCGFNGLAYVHGFEQQLATLRRVRAHLAPGGVFAFDLLVPQLAPLAEALNGAGSPMRLERMIEHPAPDVTLLLRYGVDRYDPASQILRSVITHELHSDRGAERYVSTVSWQMVFPNELTALLAAAGLRVVRRQGNYEGAPFDADSPAYLWLAEVDPSKAGGLP